MKKLRRKVTLILIMLAGVSSLSTFIVIWMIQNKIFFSQKDYRYLIFGYALRDFFLFVIALAILLALIFLFSKQTTYPILELSQITSKIAEGDFQVRVTESGRKDEIGNLQKQFNRMIGELQSNEFLKKDFISNVSHEFRTPLSIINGYAKLLEEDSLSKNERSEYAGLIVRESERLTQLTNDILRLSKLNGDEIPLKCTYFQLDEQIRQCILLLEQHWAAKHIHLQIELEPCLCYGDENLLSEVWLNLLDNAIKFSFPDGKIDISMQVTDLSPTKNAVAQPLGFRPAFSNLRDSMLRTAQIRIRDHGEGMSEETQKLMFEQFYQGDTSHKKEGSGLGLTITQKIIELHNGQIAVSSESGKGSLFQVSLPV